MMDVTPDSRGVDLPDGSAAAAISTIATATGAYGHFETHPLMTSSALPAVLARARTVGERFARPGDPGAVPQPQGSGR